MTHPRYIEALRDELLALFREARLEDQPPPFISFPDAEWDQYVAGPVNIAFRRPETARAITRLEKKLHENQGWHKKWSRKYIDRAFTDALAQIGDRSAAKINAALLQMAAKLDEEPKLLKVIFPLGGVSLSQNELRVGDIRLLRMDASGRRTISERLHAIIETVKATDDEKVFHRQQADELVKSFANLTVAEVPSAGDPQRAEEAAAALIEPVLDFLQLIAAIEESGKRIRVTSEGDLIARQPPQLTIADDGSDAHWTQKFAVGYRLELSEERVSRIVALGFESVVAAIAKGEDERSDFEDMLINAIHWIADAERQELGEHRILGYVTAMELLVTSDDGPISRDLSESVAYLLGTDLSHRKQIKALLIRLYGQRSKVTHEGFRDSRESDLIDLKNIAIKVVAAMSRMSACFATKADVRAFFADLRLSATFDPEIVDVGARGNVAGDTS